MRRIELQKTRCAMKNGKECPLGICDDYFPPGGFMCALDPQERNRQLNTMDIKRLAFCRQEFPDGVIEIRAGEVKS